MSVRMPNVLSTAPPVVPVHMAPHPGWMRHPKTREILSASTEGCRVFGDGQVPSGSRIPFPLVQGYIIIWQG